MATYDFKGLAGRTPDMVDTSNGTNQRTAAQKPRQHKEELSGKCRISFKVKTKQLALRRIVVLHQREIAQACEHQEKDPRKEQVSPI